MRKNKTPVVTEETRAEANDPNTSAARLSELYYRYPTILTQTIAQHPNAPPALLETLAETKALRPLIARNPNTPMPLLYNLWPKNPEGLRDNPALPLWQLEDPNFWASLPDPVMRAFLALPGLEEQLLSQIWQQSSRFSYDTYAALVKHPNAPEALLFNAARSQSYSSVVANRPDIEKRELFLLLLGSADAYTRTAVRNHKNLPKELMSLCLRIGWGASSNTTATMDPAVTTEELMSLTASGVYLALRIVSHPNATPEILQRVFIENPLKPSSQRDDLWASLAIHPNTDESLLRQLLASDRQLALHIARRRDLSLKMYRALLEARTNTPVFPRVLTNLAENTKTPDHILARLARQHTAHCYTTILSRKELSRPLIRTFMEISIPSVQLSLLARTELTTDDLKELTRSKSAEVRRLAAMHSNAPRDLLAAPPAAQQRTKTLTAESHTPKTYALFDALFTDTPLPILRSLVEDPLAPPDLLSWFTQRHLEKITQNPAPRVTTTQQEALRILQSKAPSQLATLSHHDDPIVRRALAKHPDTSLIFMLSVISRGIPGELLALSKNPNLPEPLQQWISTIPRLKPRASEDKASLSRG